MQLQGLVSLLTLSTVVLAGRPAHPNLHPHPRPNVPVGNGGETSSLSAKSTSSAKSTASAKSATTSAGSSRGSSVLTSSSTSTSAGTGRGSSTLISSSTSTSAGTGKSSSTLISSSTTFSSSASTGTLTPGCVNGPSSRQCWGAFDINTDYGTTWPNTGATQSYTFHITNTTLSPDGTSKQVLAINGQIPGPTIEANWGDIISVTVYNDMQTNGTSIHFHGVRQLNSNSQDGVNGVTECALAPGDSKTYTFQATDYGSTWYHSHFSTQYGDGIQGPMVIHGPASANYDEDLGTFLFSDSYPKTAFQEAYFAERSGAPTASNYLINGVNMKTDGSAGTRFTETFTAGKKYLLRLINTSVENFMTVALDGHTMTVVATDFTPIKPYTTSGVKINIGQRYDVIIEANQAVSSYWLRAMVGSCSKNSNNGLGSIANGVISYSGASSALPTSKAGSFSNTCVDEPAASLVPIVPATVDSSSFSSNSLTLPAGTTSVSTADGSVTRWTLSGTSEVVDWSNPTLLDIASGGNNQTAAANIVTLSNANVWSFFIVESKLPVEHPFHIHGHRFSVLGTGSGTYSSSQLSSLNFNNPPRRDVATLPAGGWLVMAFKTDNPGVWLLHCHIAWHASQGLSMQVLEVPSAIPSLYPVQSSQLNTCSNWKKYIAAGPVFKQDDSGLKKRSTHVVRHAAVHKAWRRRQ